MGISVRCGRDLRRQLGERQLSGPKAASFELSGGSWRVDRFSLAVTDGLPCKGLADFLVFVRCVCDLRRQLGKRQPSGLSAASFKLSGGPWTVDRFSLVVTNEKKKKKKKKKKKFFLFSPPFV